MKKMTLRTFVCLLVIWSLTIFTFAGPGEMQGTKCDDAKNVKKQLRAYFSQLAEEEFFSGSVLVAKEGKILLKKGYGMANYEEGKRNKANTVFSIASFTKAFTAMSIMMLEERGDLSVNDTIDAYIPDFPNGHLITIDNLLSQTSGLFDYVNNLFTWGMGNIGNFHEPLELLQYFNEEPTFTPGTAFEYSNSNYVTLGIIIEEVSGMSFRDFIKANILKPLKMRHTSYDPYEEDFPRKAIGYFDITSDPPVRAFYLHPTLPYSAGAMYSTVLDLYKWDQALYTKKLVSEETMERMFTPGHGDYGYAWYIDDLVVNGEMYKQIWHWGSYIGFHSYIARLVDEEVTIIILRNTPLPGNPNDPTKPEQALRPMITDVAAILFEND